MARLIIDSTVYVLPDNYPVFTWTRSRFNWNLVLEDTYIFTSNLVNTARFGDYNEKPTDGGTVFGVTPVSGTDAVAKIGLRGSIRKASARKDFPRWRSPGFPL